MSSTNPKSFRCSEDDLKSIATIGLEQGCTSDSDVLRFLIKWYFAKGVPAPISPQIAPTEDLKMAIKEMARMNDALAPVAKHLYVRHNASQTPHERAVIDEWHKKAEEFIPELERARTQLRRVRLGVLATRDLDVLHLRTAAALVKTNEKHYRKELDGVTAADPKASSIKRLYQAYTELGTFLEVCGITPPPPTKPLPSTKPINTHKEPSKNV